MKKLVLLTLVTMGLSISAHATSQEVFGQSVSGHGWCGITYDSDDLSLMCSDGSMGFCVGVDDGVAECNVGAGRKSSTVRGGISGGVNWLINNLDVAKVNTSSSNPAPANKFIGNAIEGSEYLPVCYATMNRISDIMSSQGMKKEEVAPLRKIANLYKQASYIELPKNGLNKAKIDFELQRRKKEARSLDIGSDAMTGLMLFCRGNSKFYKKAFKVVQGKK